MNIHFTQVEKKTQLSFHLLTALAVFIVLLLILSFSRRIELRLSIHSIFMQTAQTESNDVPVPILAPLPPATQAQATATPERAEKPSLILVPQVISAPVPFVP